MTTALDCFLQTIANIRASANTFNLAVISGNSFFDGLAALPGLVSIAQSGLSESETETRASNRDENPGNAPCPGGLIAPSSSEWGLE